MKPILQTERLSYTYPGSAAQALRELNLSIPEGKKTAICGHNGSGKSTLFLQSIGICRPDGGTLRWKGEPLTYKPKELKRLRRQIGLVFQDPEQQLILNTPYEDVSYGLRNAGMAEADIHERTYAMLELLELGALADTPIHHLSLGQKKRVALAGVLVLEPELLLLDEPTAYLDRSSEKRLIAELDRIHNRGMTTVMATHDMNLVYAWADWVLVLEKGRCVTEGTPEQVFKDAALMHMLGLELPMLVEVWNALPESIRNGRPAPRNVEELKRNYRTFLCTNSQEG
ncbi:energy-coupling factor ABC transporter ATP-binding protein [Paenibacillus beijingensis]|uniref:Cobalt ABC transporter ATP-binding protein n=1 Tax=Paenibacillus beijingensis TaxID=1126833 RepID=A0A0D5NQC3_9BACL|nr:ABC transporter ATP-binding protein [Paenibacillus beijingensis]AJY77466.1 cobalt ABC transporter ATP-binding protein [Paenibacillus beijingensis]